MKKKLLIVTLIASLVIMMMPMTVVNADNGSIIPDQSWRFTNNDTGWTTDVTFGTADNPTMHHGLSIVGGTNAAGEADMYHAGSSIMDQYAKIVDTTTVDSHYMQFSIPEGQPLTKVGITGEQSSEGINAKVYVIDENGEVAGSTRLEGSIIGAYIINLKTPITGTATIAFSMDSGEVYLSSVDAYYQSLPDVHTVTFCYQDNSTPDYSVEVKDGEMVMPPADPTRDGYVFQGWSGSKYGIGGIFDFTTPITTDRTLYAQWEKVADDDDNGGGSSWLDGLFGGLGGGGSDDSGLLDGLTSAEESVDTADQTMAFIFAGIGLLMGAVTLGIKLHQLRREDVEIMMDKIGIE